MIGTDTEWDFASFVASADRVYEERLKESLEREHFGEVIALEPQSGEFVLARDFHGIDIAARKRFGDRPVHIFRVGGGGAVRIGAGVPYGRLS